MNQSTIIPIADPQPTRTKICTLITAGYLSLFEYVGNILTLASTAIHGRLVAPLRLLWAHYYGRVGVAMPLHSSALGYIIIALLALAEIKSQFQTHPQAIMLSVTSVLMYGLFSFAELLVSATGPRPSGTIGKLRLRN